MSWVNYDDVLAQLQEHGLQVTTLEVDTTSSVRCYVEGEGREKRGWYWLHDIWLDNDDGGKDQFLVGAYGIFHGTDAGTQKVKIRRDGKAAKLTKEQREAINNRRRDQQKIVKARRKAEAERAGARAAAAWRKYLPTGESEYLAQKGVNAHGLRFSPSGNGTVAVPMTDDRGRIWGLQIIRSHPGQRRRQKEYWPKGMSKNGRYHLIGGTPRGVCLLCEGYATGASLYQAIDLPTVVAFDANNLRPVAQAIKSVYPNTKFLVCADDDYRTDGNPGITRAGEAALAVGGKHLAPVFTEQRAEDGPKGPTDFNDLHQLEGLHVVRAQIAGFLSGVGWGKALDSQAARGALNEGCGEVGPMAPRLSLDEAAMRYWGTYGLGGKALFDTEECALVHQDDVANLLGRHGLSDLRAHADWRVARKWEIGFDPGREDSRILCNLFKAWPTTPTAGDCDGILDLLQYLCSAEQNRQEVYEWLIRWIAYPLQHPGAKMHSAVVVHGPQGTGKSMVFEALVRIYGEYGRVLGQEALEDKFNADWAEKKLFILADEILAKTEMYHVKNRLKGFITGSTIRVNPKNMAAHEEQNHMNIVFLSNERHPLILENDDRRHCVIWTPPKLDEPIYRDVSKEMANGGIDAFYHYLLNFDLGEFEPWTRPPMTDSKRDLIHLSQSSEERFVRSWRSGEVEFRGQAMPFCPCLGSHLYKVYERWCDDNGEFRPRPANHFINFLAKLNGWEAGKSQPTWNSFRDQTKKNRRMVVPSARDMQLATEKFDKSSGQAELMRTEVEKKLEWLTRGHWAFGAAADFL